MVGGQVRLQREANRNLRAYSEYESELVTMCYVSVLAACPQIRMSHGITVTTTHTGGKEERTKSMVRMEFMKSVSTLAMNSSTRIKSEGV